MSDRISVISEFIYCKACAEVTLRVLAQIPDQREAFVEVVSGCVGALYLRDSWHLGPVKRLYLDAQIKDLCHPVRLVVFLEAATLPPVVITYFPDGSVSCEPNLLDPR